MRFLGGGMAGEDVGSGLIVESPSKTSLVSVTGPGVAAGVAAGVADFLGRPRGLGVEATDGAGVVDLRPLLVALLGG